jgi:TrmH family RNA methyltransferase
MKKWKDNVYFILVEPKEPGNIGAAARAIKNMDFRNLCLVNPPPFQTDEARLFAHGATDILKSVKVYPSLKDAIGDKHYVAGTSRRRGRRRGVFTPVEQGTQRLFEVAQNNRVAVLFGREDKGLFNNEIEECGFLMTVPASRKQPSLNLAQAVLIIAYEISKAGTKGAGPKGNGKSDHDNLLFADPQKLVTQEKLSHLYGKIERAFKMIDYIPKNEKVSNKKIMLNLKHCLSRGGLSDWEFNMFHAICNKIEKKIGDGK